MLINEYPEKTVRNDDDFILVSEPSGVYKKLLMLHIVSSASSSFIQLLDRRTSGTVGGYAIQNSWSSRPLNIIQTDDTGLVTLNNNAFVLPAGIYEIDAKAAFYALYDTKMRIRNTTDDTTLLYGLISSFNPNGGAVGTSHLTGKFAIEADKALALQYFTVAGGTSSQYNFGGSVSDGSPEVYAVIDLRKIG